MPRAPHALPVAPAGSAGTTPEAATASNVSSRRYGDCSDWGREAADWRRVVVFESNDEPASEQRRAELGKFLRARRERGCAPGDFGMPAGLRRRTPGLRAAEEVALLAGVGRELVHLAGAGPGDQREHPGARRARPHAAARPRRAVAHVRPRRGSAGGGGRRALPASRRAHRDPAGARPAARGDHQLPVRHPRGERRVRRPVPVLALAAVHPPQHTVVRADRAGCPPTDYQGYDEHARYLVSPAARRLRQARRRPGLGGGHPPPVRPER